MIDTTNPRVIARSRAHFARRPGTSSPCPAATLGADHCTCEPTPEDLADVWQGRARMAAARRAAGARLDAYDRQALDRYPQHQE